jgi:HEPN domain-containing protein
MTPALLDAHLNNFALCCFRDTADGDYISARMAYRAQIIRQALWASQQAIEKYLKCLLLLQRVVWNKSSHSLVKPLEELEKRFPLKIGPETHKFIEYVDIYGPDRYFTYPSSVDGREIVKLDCAVFDIRRYWIPYYKGKNPVGTPGYDSDIRHIEAAGNGRPQAYKSLSPGLLDQIMADESNPAYKPLIWKNMYFGKSTRHRISLMQAFRSENSPLALYPHICHEVSKYVYIPKEVKPPAANTLAP